MLDPGWCCSQADSNGLWDNDRWPAGKFFAAWQDIAARYQPNPLVAAMDIMNEPRQARVGRRVLTPTWGTRHKTDVAAMYTTAGNLVHQISPHVLIICEGLSYAADLTGVARQTSGMTTEDPYDLQRFVAAQDAGGTYDRAIAELRGGRKTSHWMWFIFPQIAGLGYSPVSRTYAISSLEEARAYLAHPVLGARLTECAGILADVRGRTAEQIFGEVDALKLRSCVTLFLRAAPGEQVFRQVLNQYFDGAPDSATEQRI